MQALVYSIVGTIVGIMASPQKRFLYMLLQTQGDFRLIKNAFLNGADEEKPADMHWPHYKLACHLDSLERLLYEQGDYVHVKGDKDRNLACRLLDNFEDIASYVPSIHHASVSKVKGKRNKKRALDAEDTTLDTDADGLIYDALSEDEEADSRHAAQVTDRYISFI
jgi:hypothetical protein